MSAEATSFPELEAVRGAPAQPCPATLWRAAQEIVFVWQDNPERSEIQAAKDEVLAMLPKIPPLCALFLGRKLAHEFGGRSCQFLLLTPRVIGPDVRYSTPEDDFFRRVDSLAAAAWHAARERKGDA